MGAVPREKLKDLQQQLDSAKKLAANPALLRSLPDGGVNVQKRIDDLQERVRLAESALPSLSLDPNRTKPHCSVYGFR